MWDLSSPIRDWTCIPCTGRQILNHWTTREVPCIVLMVDFIERFRGKRDSHVKAVAWSHPGHRDHTGCSSRRTTRLMENWKLGHNYLREERSKGNVLGPFEAHCHMGGASKVALVVKNPPAKARDTKDPWVREIPWRRPWQPTPVFLPGESHGQRSLVGYSPLGHKESDTTEET